jgi:hypothetical protein
MSWKIPAPRARIGRHIVYSRTRLITATAATPPTIATHSGAPALTLIANAT